MMQRPAYVEQLRKEKRILAVHNEQLKRSQQLQKHQADELKEVVKEKDKQISQLEKENKRLQEELEKTKAERDTYKHLTFKEKRVCSSPFSHQATGMKRGGKVGHKGASRMLPEHIHRVVHVFLSHCPDCGGRLNRAQGVAVHTVTDLPHWSQMMPITTRYETERQWCANCQREVKGVPQGVIPGVRFGSVFLTMVLTWKYRFREPLTKITERLTTDRYPLK